MAYVGIDTLGARALGGVLGEAAAHTESVRGDVVAALDLADLASEAPAKLA